MPIWIEPRIFLEEMNPNILDCKSRGYKLLIENEVVPGKQKPNVMLLYFQQ